MDRKVAIVIPTYNERNNISELIKRIVKNFSHAYIYIVDDNSPDNTKEKVNNLRKKYKSVSLIVRERKSGRGGAVLCGFSEAFRHNKIEYFIEMDADLSHQPEEIIKLLDKTSPNTVVVGSRYVKGSKILNWPLYRQILSRLANIYAKTILRVGINDFTNGFRCYPRRAIKVLLRNNINHKGFIALSEMVYILHSKKFEFKEVPINFLDREMGKSNATIVEVLKSLLAILEVKMRIDKTNNG